MQVSASPKSLLTAPGRHPLHSSAEAAALGATVVFAPHPDDESLGCGGLLALLAEARIPAHVVVMTDGSRSHPNSLSHPSASLATVREAETLNAASELGLPATAVEFLRYPDCGLPPPGTIAFAEAAARLREVIVALAPETVLIPWRRDPHCDHEATYHLLRAAVLGLDPAPRWLEYPIWAWPQAEGPCAPRADEGRAWRLDIAPALERKGQAIAQHRSQLGWLIRDDETGFVLQPQMLAHFQRPWELFIAPHDV